MPTFLSDPEPTFYLVLITAAVVAGAVAFRYQDKRTLAAFFLAAGVLLAVFVIDLLCESPREESVRKVKAMAAAGTAKDWKALGEHLSDKFQFQGHSKASFLGAVSGPAAAHGAEVNVKGFDRESFEPVSETTLRIGFIAQVSTATSGPLPYYVEATFTKDPDGQFRMTGFDLYNFAKRKNGPKENMPI